MRKFLLLLPLLLFSCTSDPVLVEEPLTVADVISVANRTTIVSPAMLFCEDGHVEVSNMYPICPNLGWSYTDGVLTITSFDNNNTITFRVVKESGYVRIYPNTSRFVFRTGSFEGDQCLYFDSEWYNLI